MVGARVNGKLVPIEYSSRMALHYDHHLLVEFQGTKPRLAERRYICSYAKNKIDQWFKTQMKEDNIIRGRDAIDQ